MHEKPTVSVEIVDDGPCRKRLKAEIPAASVRQELESNYRQLSKTIQLPGFRKGRVPRSLLERRFATQIHTDVQEELMSSSFQEEVERLELKVLGEPTYDKVEFQADSPMRFEAVFEVFPTFELGDYQSLQVPAMPYAVTDEDAAREVESLRQEASTFEDVTEGDLQDGDVAICKLTMRDGDEVLVERGEVYLKVGTDRVDSIVVEGMGKRLRAARVGSDLSFQVTVPEDFPRDTLRNRNVNLELQLRSMKRTRLPALDDDFASRLGVDTLENLRKRVKDSLVARRKNQEEHRQEDALLDQLVERLEAMELPPSVVERKLEEVRLHERLRLVRAGKSESEIEQLIAQDTSSEERARKELKKLFVLDRVAENEKIFVLEDEIWKRLAQIAAARGEDPAQLATEYSESGALAGLRDGIQREKVRRFLREKAVVLGGMDDGDGPDSSATRRGDSQATDTT